MSDLAQVMDAIYTSLNQDNEGLDEHIDTLKKTLAAQGKNSIEVDPTRLAQPNRQGRKLMQSYFKKRGVNVVFSQA